MPFGWLQRNYCEHRKRSIMPCKERHLPVVIQKSNGQQHHLVRGKHNAEPTLQNDKVMLQKHGYNIGSTIGEGAYAKVKSAFDNNRQNDVAIKIINRQTAPKHYQEKFLSRELKILRMVCHPNIVDFYDIMHWEAKVFIVMELVNNGSLLSYIRKQKAIPEQEAGFLFQQIVNGLQYLHNMDVIHRDLKCENILLDDKHNVKLCDFGFARIIKDGDICRTSCGSSAYAAPEILQGFPYSSKASDMWSLGVILYTMVCGSRPYDDSNIQKMIKYQISTSVGFVRTVCLSEHIQELVHQMLEPDVTLRYTVEQVQESQWLTSIRENLSEKDWEYVYLDELNSNKYGREVDSVTLSLFSDSMIEEESWSRDTEESQINRILPPCD